MFCERSRYCCFLLSALTLILSTIGLTDCEVDSSQKFDWDKVLKAWNAYFDYPSSENADNVTALLPDSGHVVYTGNPKEERTLDSIWQGISMLERQVYAGDRSAVKLAFRLGSIADGGFAEALDIILGALIRINAQLFLEELQKNRCLVMRLESLVGNFGPEYWYSDRAERLEANLRIKALEKIQDTSLVNIRDQCIEGLKALLERLERIER